VLIKYIKKKLLHNYISFLVLNHKRITNNDIQKAAHSRQQSFFLTLQMFELENVATLNEIRILLLQFFIQPKNKTNHSAVLSVSGISDGDFCIAIGRYYLTPAGPDLSEN